MIATRNSLFPLVLLAILFALTVAADPAGAQLPCPADSNFVLDHPGNVVHTHVIDAPADTVAFTLGTITNGGGAFGVDMAAGRSFFWIDGFSYGMRQTLGDRYTVSRGTAGAPAGFVIAHLDLTFSTGTYFWKGTTYGPEGTLEARIESPAGVVSWELPYTSLLASSSQSLSTAPFAMTYGESFELRWDVAALRVKGVAGLSMRLWFEPVAEEVALLTSCQAHTVDLTPVEPVTWSAIKNRFR